MPVMPADGPPDIRFEPVPTSCEYDGALDGWLLLTGVLPPLVLLP